MKVLVDLNVVLDVLQHREPHYTDSAKMLDAVLRHVVEGVLPSHSVTTLSYLIDKHTSGDQARDSVQWILDHFQIASATHQTFQAASKFNCAGNVEKQLCDAPNVPSRP